MSRLRQSAFTREGISLLLFGLVLAPALFGWLIIDLTRQQDEIANQAHRNLASGMIESVARTQTGLLLDNCIWDEMYERTVLNEDQDWLDKTAGPDSGANAELNAVLVIDEDMRPVIGSWYSHHWLWEPELLFPQHFRSLFQEAVTNRERGYATGFMPLRGAVVVVSIGRIRPVDIVVDLRDPIPPRYLVFAHVLDAASIAALRDTLSWPDMTVSAVRPEGPSLAIRDADGHEAGYVGWQHPHLALDALRARLPMLVGGLSITSIASLGLYLRMRRVYRKLQQAEKSALDLANSDHLTGIPNRRAMQAIIGQMLTGNGPVYLLLIDFDGFKEVNDRLGHRVGDLLLVEMTTRMNSLLPPSATLARIGGDEFAIVLCSTRGEAMELGYDIVMTISAPFQAPCQVISISASIGVAEAEPGMTTEELIRRADLAMYSAKSEHPGLTRHYDEALDAKRRYERETADDIKAGLARGEFHVAYQPITSARENRVIGVEALARWDHPSRGAVSPAEFIPIAEQSRLILQLGDFILRSACRELAQSAGDLYVSVNLSPVQMLDDCVVERIAAILEETGLPATRLELEVTEGYLIEQEDRAVAMLTRLRALGVRISLDDFGCGYASIGYLRRLPLDKVKIDRSFVEPLETVAKARTVAAAVVALCRSFDLTITAEGVETEGQAAFLREIGCDRFQGYLFGRPARTLPALPLPGRDASGAVAS